MNALINNMLNVKLQALSRVGKEVWISEWIGGLYPRDNSNKQRICTVHILSTLLVDIGVDIGVDKIPTWYANLAWGYWIGFTEGKSGGQMLLLNSLGK